MTSDEGNHIRFALVKMSDAERDPIKEQGLLASFTSAISFTVVAALATSADMTFNAPSQLTASIVGGVCILANLCVAAVYMVFLARAICVETCGVGIRRHLDEPGVQLHRVSE